MTGAALASGQPPLEAELISCDSELDKDLVSPRRPAWGSEIQTASAAAYDDGCLAPVIHSENASEAASGSEANPTPPLTPPPQSTEAASDNKKVHQLSPASQQLSPGGWR